MGLVGIPLCVLVLNTYSDPDATCVLIAESILSEVMTFSGNVPLSLKTYVVVTICGVDNRGFD